MDSIFIEGVAATVSAVIVFCGSVFLLLAMVLGARLAYFITACITLAFLFMMGLVWAFTNQASPLGPVGTLPSWDEVAIGESQDELEFGAAQQYPDAPWKAPNEEDEAEVTQAAELESDAATFLERAIDEGEVEQCADPTQAQVAEGSTRLLEQEEGEYGALTFEPVPAPSPTASPTEGGDGGGTGGGASPSPSPSPTGPPAPPEDARVYVVMQFDPGNPLGLARIVLVLTALALIGHLLGLARAERRTRELRRERRGEAT